VNNDCVEVDELILEIGDYKNDYADMAAEKLFRNARPVGRLINTCETARTIAGYPTAHVSSYDELSKRYKCKSTNVANTAMRIRGRDSPSNARQLLDTTSLAAQNPQTYSFTCSSTFEVFPFL
jgi:hypothetical protein